MLPDRLPYDKNATQNRWRPLMAPPLPPGPRDWTMGIWTARQMATNVFAFFRGLQRDYGDIVHLRLGPYHDFVFFHPDQIREVLVAKARHFEKMPRIRQVMGQLDGNGLVTSEGDSWLRQRRLVQPAFHAKRLGGYGQAARRRSYGWERRSRLIPRSPHRFDCC